MKSLRMLLFDIRYQIKYGFYFLYLVISVVYLVILLLLPRDLNRSAAALIILTDPAALGFFFIGGIVLLERDEGLHAYYSILPASNRTYVLSKTVSLSLISTVVALVIAGIMFGSDMNYILLSIGVFAGASVFTMFGLAAGTVAKSINQYFVIGIPIGAVLISPAFLIYFNIHHILVEIMPSTLLLRVLYASLYLEIPYPFILALVGLLLWCVPAYVVADRLFAKYMQRIGG